MEQSWSNDIDTVGKCANCGVEFHIHKPLSTQSEAKHLLDFCHFIGKEGYKINGYDDGQLTVVIEKFLNIQSAPVAQ